MLSDGQIISAAIGVIVVIVLGLCFIYRGEGL